MKKILLATAACIISLSAAASASTLVNTDTPAVQAHAFGLQLADKDGGGNAGSDDHGGNSGKGSANSGSSHDDSDDDDKDDDNGADDDDSTDVSGCDSAQDIAEGCSAN